MRRRIVAVAVLAAILAISLFGVPLAVGVAKYYADDERTELERLAGTAALSVSADLVRSRTSGALPATESGTTLTLYGPTGVRLRGTGPDQLDDVVGSATSGNVATGSTSDIIVVAVPITDNGSVVAIVRAASRYSVIHRRTALTWLVMLGLGALAVTATWLVARWQAARLARPLEQLSRTAERLGDGDFTVRARQTRIPEIDSVGATLVATARRLDELLARERSFSSSVSHQLRTPLAGLRLQLEAAVDAGPAAQLAAISVGIESADRLERTIDDLLALTRDNHPPYIPVDMTGLLDEVHSDWHGLLAAKGRVLRLDTEPGVPDPRAPVAAVRQILYVLVDNAVRHGSGTVAVTVRDAAGAVAVEVTDEGPGVDAEADLFTRHADATGRHGIGLPMARDLAEAVGGRLLLTRHRPARFTLLLPAAPSLSVSKMSNA